MIEITTRETCLTGAKEGRKEKIQLLETLIKKFDELSVYKDNVLENLEFDKRYEEKYLNMLRDMALNLLEGKKCEAFLFGSRVDGEQKRLSDYDIGISGLDEKDFYRLRRRLYQEVEESIIPHTVDLVDFNKVSDKFKTIALKKVIIWKKD